jgi:uncharacterized protein YuzE
MMLHYYPETDSLYIELRDIAGEDAREVADGVVADFASDGGLVGIDIDQASRFDLAALETVGVPWKGLRAA